MAGTHTLWSPSAAKAWRTCLAYPVMNDGAPDESSIYAAEGTAYHALVDEAFHGGKLPSARIGERVQADGFTFTVTDEDAAYAEDYLAVLRARQEAGCIVSVEVRTDTSALLGIPGQAGTVDGRVFDLANDTLEIRDLKFGKGVKVYAYERGALAECVPMWQRVNDQIGTYGASEFYAWQWFHPFKFLKLCIHQPRIGWYDEVTLTAQDVDAFAEALHADALASHRIWQARETIDVAQHLKPSHAACRWCYRAGSCRVRANAILEMFK
jgi:hypothetical protein